MRVNHDERSHETLSLLGMCWMIVYS